MNSVHSYKLYLLKSTINLKFTAMKRLHLFLLMFAVQTVLLAQQYFPEGTKWTEIRIDTLKYDSWYSKAGNEWIPNFETIEYQIRGDYVEKNDSHERTYKYVFAQNAGTEDSLALLIHEDPKQENEGDAQKWVTATLPIFHEGNCVLEPGLAYDFNWIAGRELYSISIEGAMCNCINADGYNLGKIKEIKEGFFGGERPLKYVDMEGVRIIQGIGVTEWPDGECVFGPIKPYPAFFFGMEDYSGYKERHYRSMLVHFERNGEVLYDVWPQKDADGIEGVYVSEKIAHGSTYDLSGRTVVAPRRGLYIKDGKKVSIR